jgi:acyl carrier protein
MEIADKIRQFIKQNFYTASTTGLTDEASLLELGIIDSTGILEVVSYLESEFQIHVKDDEMLPENLDSIAKIASFVTRKHS